MIQRLMPLQIKALEYAENHSELLACFSEEDLLHFNICMKEDVIGYTDAARRLYGFSFKADKIKKSFLRVLKRSLACLRYIEKNHISLDTPLYHGLALIIDKQVVSTCAWDPDATKYSFIVSASELPLFDEDYNTLLHWSSLTGFQFSCINYDGSVAKQQTGLYQFLIRTNYIPFTITKCGLKIDHYFEPLNKNKNLLTNKSSSPPSVQTQV